MKTKSRLRHTEVIPQSQSLGIIQKTKGRVRGKKFETKGRCFPTKTGEV